MGIRLTPENIEKMLVVNEGYVAKSHYCSKNYSKDTTYKIVKGKLLKCKGLQFNSNEATVCDMDETRGFLRRRMTSLKIIEQGCLSKGYSAPSVSDYRMNLPQYCEIASKEMFEDRLIDYEVDGNIVNLTFKSRSGKTAWQSEIVFKKDGHICWSTPFCDNSTFFFGNRVLEVAGVK